MTPVARSGYTLPVFACAAAKAALQYLRQPQGITAVSVDLGSPPQTVVIPIEQLAPLPGGAVLGVTRSDPGDNLDLTRYTPVWALVAWGDPGQEEPLVLEGGEGVGRSGGQAAIYAYARSLMGANLTLMAGETLRVTIILPEGRALGERTANPAFGVVGGLGLLGTTGISQPLSAPEQLDSLLEQLGTKAAQSKQLVFCVGENGLDLARQAGVPPEVLVKTANWLGPLLVAAGLQGVEQLLLLGYHGKLIKLAGGIFHTHHHLADGRQEIFTAHAGALGVPAPHLQVLLASPTAEAARQYLLGVPEGPLWLAQIDHSLGTAIDRRTQAYILKHSQRLVRVGCGLFSQARRWIYFSQVGQELWQSLIPSPQDLPAFPGPLDHGGGLP